MQEAKPYGPWQCQSSFGVAFGNSPLLLQPCHALGSRVQMRVTVAAPTGGQASVGVALQDMSTGRTVSGPKTCGGLTFDRSSPTHVCGPATAGVSHGHTYVVVATWTYSRAGQNASGTAKGRPFAW